MKLEDQLDALKKANELIFSVEKARRSEQAAGEENYGYRARVELGYIEHAIKVKLGFRK